MRTFKEMVASDRDIVLNINELGEEHNIAGKPVICVIDDKTLRDRQGGAEYAVGTSYMYLFAKCEDLPKRKGYGYELMVDGIPYTVESWDEDMGIASIALFISVNQGVKA